jgi:hypothetical protein
LSWLETWIWAPGLGLIVVFLLLLFCPPLFSGPNEARHWYGPEASRQGLKDGAMR